MELLEKHFDTAFAAPDGIQKLRELILTLAMQGKLVPQDPDDQPSSELLKAIEAEKQKLVKEGKIKKLTSLSEVKLKEMPYQLPKGWEWVRLGNYCYIFSGNAFKSEDFNSLGGTRAIKITNAGVGKLIETSDFLPERFAVNYSDYQVRENDLVLALTRPYISSGLKISICPSNYDGALLNQRVAAIRPFKFFRFIFLFLSSPQVLCLYQARFRGSGLQPNLKMGDVTDLLVPIPPLAEQHRIVAKIDRLMARCDELEKLRGDRNQKRITIHTAALNRLLTAKESSDFSTAWRFITQHFGELYSVKENVAELRKAILQLAVMGKLVPQDPTDEPASELLKAIEAEKQKLVKEEKIKKTKIVTPIERSDVPFPLPDIWIWARTEALCEVIVDCPHSTPIFTTSGFVCIDTNVFKNGALIPHKIRYVSEETYVERIQRLVPQPGDVVFAREGSVGESVILPEEMNCCLGQRVMLFRLAQYVLPTYFRLALSERSSLSRLLDLHKGIGAKHVNVLDMRNALIPLPPLAEQRRIVAKIDQLMALCNRLEQQIDAATSKRTELLNALMAQV